MNPDETRTVDFESKKITGTQTGTQKKKNSQNSSINQNKNQVIF